MATYDYQQGGNAIKAVGVTVKVLKDKTYYDGQLLGRKTNDLDTFEDQADGSRDGTQTIRGILHLFPKESISPTVDTDVTMLVNGSEYRKDGIKAADGTKRNISKAGETAIREQCGVILR